ncbi:MAG TPA: hypothetical protein VJH92_06045 [Candidatus Nanoarchaeia archaeon]|nr:hypothetical protein [Candidatus Nanoarchaeia archaeon]
MGLDDELKKLGIGSTKITICTECTHFINLEPNSSRKDVWYNHLCSANKLPTKIDPYDGKKKPFGVNALGDAVFSDKPHKYCRDLNEGNCRDFSNE